MPTEAENESLFKKPPREFSQARSKRTYENLIGAASAMFAERGFDTTQTPDIAAAASMSVGTFYRYFSDKREVFLEVIRRYLESVHERVLTDLTPDKFVGAGRRQTIDMALDVLVDSIRREPGLQSVFFEMSMRDDKVAALRAASATEVCRKLAALFTVICPRSVVPDPAATAFIIHTSAVECAVATFGQRARPPVRPEAAMKALGDTLFRTLFGLESVTESEL